MKTIKKKFILIAIIVIAVLYLQSCTKEDSELFNCTTYLNGSIWSEETVSDCSNCEAPQGYTTTCN
jgi:hypothetical protein